MNISLLNTLIERNWRYALCGSTVVYGKRYRTAKASTALFRVFV